MFDCRIASELTANPEINCSSSWLWHAGQDATVVFKTSTSNCSPHWRHSYSYIGIYLKKIVSECGAVVLRIRQRRQGAKDYHKSLVTQDRLSMIHRRKTKWMPCRRRRNL